MTLLKNKKKHNTRNKPFNVHGQLSPVVRNAIVFTTEHNLLSQTQSLFRLYFRVVTISILCTFHEISMQNISL